MLRRESIVAGRRPEAHVAMRGPVARDTRPRAAILVPRDCRLMCRRLEPAGDVFSDDGTELWDPTSDSSNGDSCHGVGGQGRQRVAHAAGVGSCGFGGFTAVDPESAKDTFGDGEGEIVDLEVPGGPAAASATSPQVKVQVADDAAEAKRTAARRQGEARTMARRLPTADHVAPVASATLGSSSGREAPARRHPPQAKRQQPPRATPAMAAEQRCHGRSKAEAAGPQSEFFSEARTTVMLQRIPYDLTGNDMCRALDEIGLAHAYDAVAVPCNHKSGRNLGYGFVNFVHAVHAAACIALCNGRPFGRGGSSSNRVCFVEHSAKQGLGSVLQCLSSTLPKHGEPVSGWQ